MHLGHVNQQVAWENQLLKVYLKWKQSSVDLTLW